MTEVVRPAGARYEGLALVVATLAVIAGALLAFAGLQSLFRVVLRALPEELDHEHGGMERFGNRRSLLLLGIAGVLTAVIASVARPREKGLTRVDSGCNGDPRLCARRLELGPCGGNTGFIVVRSVVAAAQDHVAIRIPRGGHGGSDALFRDPEKGLRT